MSINIDIQEYVKRGSIREVIHYFNRDTTYSVFELISNDYDYRSCLCLACEYNHPKIVNHLIGIRRDDQVIIKNSIGETPLMIACRSGNLKIVKMLIRSTHNSHLIELVELSPSLRSCLHYAVIYGHIHVVDYILEYVPKEFLNIVDRNGLTPLHYAIQKSYIDIVKSLIDSGADANLVTRISHKPSRINHTLSVIEFAMEHQSHEAVLLLVKNGASIKHSSKLILYAIEHSLIDMLEYIICSDDFDINSNYEIIPLHYACLRRNIEAVRVLLDCPTLHKHIEDRSGKTALDIANILKDQSLIELLQD